MDRNTRTLAVFAGVLALAGPKRTRPLSGFLYGCLLSRAHGAARDRQLDGVRAVIERLFSEKTSVGTRVDQLEVVVQHHARSLQSHGRALDGIAGDDR